MPRKGPASARPQLSSGSSGLRGQTLFAGKTGRGGRAKRPLTPPAIRRRHRRLHALAWNHDDSNSLQAADRRSVESYSTNHLLPVGFPFWIPASEGYARDSFSRRRTLLRQGSSVQLIESSVQTLDWI